MIYPLNKLNFVVARRFFRQGLFHVAFDGGIPIWAPKIKSHKIKRDFTNDVSFII